MEQIVDIFKMLSRLGGPYGLIRQTEFFVYSKKDREAVEKCRELDIPTYKTTIREGVAIREAQTQRMSIFDYAPRSNPAKDYKQLIKEIGL